jgi:FkbM family methyltransferase
MQVPPLLRRLAELASRNRVIVRRLPRQYGRRRIYCSPDNNLRILLPAGWDQRLFEFVELYVANGSVVWDIGANMGGFSFPAATKARFVLAIEPDPFNVHLLERSRSANDLPVEVLSAAVSDQVGIAKLRIASRGRSTNSIVGASESSQTGGFRGVITTASVTLDWLLDHFPAPDIVKIDAEGAELLIFSAASALLAHRPILIVEVGGYHRVAICNLLWSHDYVLFDRTQDHPITPDLIGDDDIVGIPRSLGTPPDAANIV